MAAISDRHIIKERILDNVAKAVKSIQGKCVTADPENPVYLGNEDESCQKLCDNLDRVFLHGLKHIQRGYWKVVSEFTDKQTLKDLKHLQHVTTDLGRGRSWLFMALNDCLLESYIRCYEENIKTVRKYYVKEALLLDQQSVTVLLTLTAGLEYVVFQLEYDLPYIDMGVSPRPRSISQISSSVDDDRVSLCSMDSVASIRPLGVHSSGDTLSVSDTSETSIDPNPNSLKGENHVENKADRLDSVVVEEIENHNKDTGIEVIRLKGHGKKKRKAKKSVRRTINNSPILNEPLNEGEEDSIETVHKVESVENPLSKGKVEEKDKEPGYVSEFKEEDKLKDILSSIGDRDLSLKTSHSEESLEAKMNNAENDTEDHTKDESSVTCENNETPEVDVYKSPSPVEYDFSEVDEDGEILKNDDKKSVPENKTLHTNQFCDEMDGNTSSLNGNVQYSFPLSKSSDNSDCDIKQTFENMQGMQKKGSSERFQKEADRSAQGCEERESGSQDKNSDMTNSASEDLSIYSQSFSAVENPSSASQMQDLVDNIINQSDVSLQPHMFEEEPEETVLGGEEGSHLYPGEVMLENNTRLELMLNVFDNSEEQFIRMYVSRLGHTDGDDHPVFMLLTDHNIYLLNQSQTDFKFMKDSCVPYSSIDYISLTISDQVIHIVCKNRRNQYWLTTGSQLVTRSIVDCLQEQMKNHQDSQLTVLSDAKTQMIALRKHIAKEIHCESSDVVVACYSLVHWGSDLEAKRHKVDTAFREGHLLYRVVEASGGLSGLSSQIISTVHDPKSLLYGQSWKSAFVILRDGMLCMYAEKNGKPTMFVHMGDDCVGCRRASKSDRDHCIEVIKQDGSSWQLALANETEANDWLQKLCQAVAEGLQKKEASKPSCLPCCAILTSTKLFIFHEDLQISFFRTLGSANIADVICVLVDPSINTFCILEFESHDGGLSQDKWVFYFNDKAEKGRFLKALSDIWIDFFQIEEMPVYEIEDFSLQRTCRLTATQLENSMKVRGQKH